jgi:hypothetical protein
MLFMVMRRMSSSPTQQITRIRSFVIGIMAHARGKQGRRDKREPIKRTQTKDEPQQLQLAYTFAIEKLLSVRSKG